MTWRNWDNNMSCILHYLKKKSFTPDVSFLRLEMTEGLLHRIAMILVLYCLLVNRYTAHIHKTIDINIFNINRSIEKKALLYTKYSNDKTILNKSNSIALFFNIIWINIKQRVWYRNNSYGVFLVNKKVHIFHYKMMFILLL